MAIAEKKRLLVHLNNPRQPSLSARLVIAVLRPPALIIGFVFGNLYRLCFGWLDRRDARKREQEFADDIRGHLSFLFTDYGAEVTPNEGVPFPPGFDGAYVTVKVEDLLLRFCRGRGDFSVSVASQFAPRNWEDFRLVADGVSGWDPPESIPYSYSLADFDKTLRPRLPHLLTSLSHDKYEETLNKAVGVHNASVDEYAAKLRQSGIVPKFY